ncbi:MAG: TonB-dependent receptor [Bacteroidetes bacterium]|nr:TonB-dependent receptor [Bacteroidota bacterium]
MNLGKHLTLVIGALLFATLLQAQTVKITGKVWNTEANAPLPGASIVLTEKGAAATPGKKGVSTDVEGRFFLSAQKGHIYTLTISSVGFVTKTMDNITAGEETVALDITLENNRKSLDQVVVTTSVRKASTASLYTIQKNSSAISDGISAEVIGRSPDKNTGDVLKRVSGASVQDNKFVVIRGMAERYNVSMLNNTVLPSTEADKKAFAFDILPSSLIDNLVIYKAATPDLPGDFAGGLVKVLTKDYPSRPISELSVSVGYNTKTTGKNFYKGKPDGSLDNLGYLDDSRLIPAPYYRQRGADFINNPDNYKREVTKLFPNTYGYSAARQSLPALSASYTGGNTKIYNSGNKLGYIFSLGYGASRAVSDRIRNEYDVNRMFLYGYNTSNYDDRNNLSGLLSLAYSYGKSKIAWKTLYYNAFVKTVGLRDGINRVNDPSFFYYKSLNNEVNQNGLVNSSVEGTHQLGKSWSVNWTGSFAYTYKNQPDQKILSFRSVDNADDGYYLRVSNENSPAIRTAGRVYSFLHENIYNGVVNVNHTFSWWGLTQKFQFGTLNYYRDRSVEVDALGYGSLNFLGSADIAVAKGSDIFGTVFTKENIDKYNLTVANIGNNSTDYTGSALLNAGYVMLDNKFSDRFKMVWGLRVEKYRQKLSALNKPKVDNDNTDFLPSLLMTYSLNNKTNIRLSGSRSVNRPEFRELAAYSVYDYDNYFSTIGNPGLKRSQNTNGDLRFEYFPGAGEILSASVFYKYFKDPIEQTNENNDNLSVKNADHAYVYGAELEVRKKLDFTGNDFLSHLTVYTNAAYIKGGVQLPGVDLNTPMQGQSPYLINAGITYLSPKEDWSVNVLYNRIGPRMRFRGSNGVALSIFEAPRDVMDAQISKKFMNGKLEAKLTVSDIFAQAFRLYYKTDATDKSLGFNSNKDVYITNFKFGTTVNLGVRLNLGK